FADTVYRDIEDDFWWVPTAEVPVTNLYRDEILDGAVLPIRHVAYSPCFRRGPLSAGPRLRRAERGRSFRKGGSAEVCAAGAADAELLSLLDNAETVCRRLGLAHRVVQMCTGDLAFAAAMKYDVEVWSPGCAEWLEVSSCSNFRDFQARRAGIRYRPAPGAKPELVHTLNGSGLGVPRVLIAIPETSQRADGSAVVPDALRPYVGTDVIARGDPR